MNTKRFASLVGVLAVVGLVAFTSGERHYSAGQETAPVQKAPAENVPADDATTSLLEAIGTTGGVQLYQTYLNIGFIADGKGQQMYSDEVAQELLGTVVGPLDRVTKQFTNAKKVAVDDDDKKALDRMAKIAGLLKNQGAYLQKYWATGTDEDGERFEKTRQEAWREISDFLRLEQPPQAAEPEMAPVPEKSPN